MLFGNSVGCCNLLKYKELLLLWWLGDGDGDWLAGKIYQGIGAVAFGRILLVGDLHLSQHGEGDIASRCVAVYGNGNGGVVLVAGNSGTAD